MKSAVAVWPEAIFTVPTRLGKGPYVRPLALLSEDEVLVVTEFDVRVRFLTYNLRTKRHRVLATAPKWADCSGCYDIHVVAVGDTRIAWTVGVYRTHLQNDGKQHLELWSMPRSGGEMRKVASLTPWDGSPWTGEVEIEGDHVIWRAEDGGTYRIPLAGGEQEPVPPAEKRPAVEPGPDVRDFQCGVEWCTGKFPPRPYELTTVVVQNRNGTGRVTVPAELRSQRLIADRFGLFGLPFVYGGGSMNISDGEIGTSALVYDRCSGKSARIGSGVDDKTGAYEIALGAVVPEPILLWQTTDNRYAVLDLSRISDRACAA
ncbi:hypothetical protein SAMN05216276_101924 [Streptosporangium subroseum]|uniref:Uncharacterized protein n=1 Tax=Streptosporangium subroseum TaxID=106412 RepID=A0A239I977_9ACTN|nr:hypothetical protein [Streptosporangium subroseum]SNS90061.1 hypothetical protein SAMN05216276_101924 [Streptosporangium subroseum]